ncbi:MAG: AAA family ATPase [Oscillatoriaceae cyanobacterium Prado104]|jgi:predicted ATPase/serine phosphatase RsbU (regulator of sigma subunit)/tRNA A-37 threonylcarbamoyl transferase component Bud32|nr:AAA family ATPase [Oscillatoriaceae cyanobacterium Prado104]
MLAIPGYQILAQIYESANSFIYRGIRDRDRLPVILKLLKAELPTPAEKLRYQQEYKISKSLNFSGVVQAYSLEKYHNSLAISFEDMGAESLSLWQQKHQITLTEFLEVAIATVRIVGQIHSACIIHKDINPSNIVINPKTGEVKIIDFGISTVLSVENPTFKSPNVLEGTLAYIAPEQTGRMNRPIDYRADFYSLGATFYELLTDRQPFEGKDAIELVHCHIAKQPIEPQEVNPEIPKTLSDIVIKLLAKTAEERYQSAWGIQADLERCLTQLQTQGKIEDFPIGQYDISDKFQIPQKLYGRETEIASLLAVFERVAGGLQDAAESATPEAGQSLKARSRSEMMLVFGYSGIGKSALVQELYKPITQKKGFFISGKFDQFQRNIPYSAVIKAFQELVRQLLAESEVQLQQWREKILAAVKANGQVVIDVIPELELIIGKQPELSELPPAESQNRFNLVFHNFIRVFCQPEHPLVIFLDDLQWADFATLQLLQLIMTDVQLQYLFAIGAYRDNEVNAAHPLMLTINEIQKTECVINSISLLPLKLNDVSRLIADTLKCDIEKAQPLANLVQQKTQGNPFFINEFLKSLYAEKLLKFRATSSYQGGATGEWYWDLKEIQAKGITDNVVELMAGKIQQLSQPTQELLKFAACIGNQFDANTLAIVSGNSVKATNGKLLEAIGENLIIPMGDDYKLLEVEEVGEDLKVDYKFLHDRIQQAAYSLIPEAEKQVVRYQLGQLLLKNTIPEQREQKIFDIVNHLNFGSELIAEQSQRSELAALNLFAGKKAQASAAYKSALDYFVAGRQLLSADSWQTQYDLTLNLYQEAAESAYISTDFDRMEELATPVLQQALTVLDKVKVYQVKILAHLAQSQFRQAVDMALSVLELLGISYPKQPTPTDIQAALQTTQAALAGREIEDLIDLPPMTAPDRLAAMQVMSTTFAAAYFSFPEILPLFVFKQVNLSLEYGNSPYSLPAYANCGLFLSAIFNDIESGYRFGELALNLLDRINSSEVKAETLHIVNGFVKHCKESVRKTLKLTQDACAIGLEIGDIEYACHAGSMYALHGYFIGKELTEFEREMATYGDMMRQLKQEADLNFNEIYRQAVLNLMDRSENLCELIGEAYNEGIQLPLMLKANNRSAVFIIYLQKTILCYLFGELAGAVKYADLAAQDLAGVVGSLLAPLFYFYDSLVQIAVYFDRSESDRIQILERVNINLDRLKILATHAPMNYSHKVALIEAELCRIQGENFEAMDWYDRAIATAKENEYLNEEALSYELAAKFYISKDKTLIAKTYLQNARYCYLCWGASAKVKDLDTRYPQLLTRQTSTGTSISGTSISGTKISVPPTSTTGSSSSSILDFTTVIKASQAISGEVVLASLLSNLIKLAIENAGAQKGFLLLPNSSGELRIEAVGNVDVSAQTLQSLAVNNSQNFPLSIINYVARTQSEVVLSDATREGRFTAEPYITLNQPKSVLCAPIINQGKLIGILYLENNLATGAFTADRLAVLNILSAQAAISLENAQLYQTLEQKVEERTAQLARANAEILVLNNRLKTENIRMSAELDVTRRLQQMILPDRSELETIEGLEIAGFMEPADEVGGDYYDVLYYGSRTTIGIGDVTGHGLESGVLMIMAQTAIRALLACGETDPIKLLQAVNQTLFDNVERMNSGKNMSLSLLEYRDNTLHLTGQHEEAIVVRGSGEVERIDTMELGFPIALEADIADFIASTEISLNSGDVVVLYTDGITEAFNMKKAQYGIERLIDVVALNRELPAAAIERAVIDDLRRFIGEQKVFDDITLVVIKQK